MKEKFETKICTDNTPGLMKEKFEDTKGVIRSR
jgi:hypothetical protein